MFSPKLTFIYPIISKISNVQWHKMSGKNIYIHFFYFRFKNKRVWAEKIRKKRKNSKNIKVAGNYPNI